MHPHSHAHSHTHSNEPRYGLPATSEADVLRERESMLSRKLEGLLANPATAHLPGTGVCAAALRETRAELDRVLHGD